MWDRTASRDSDDDDEQSEVEEKEPAKRGGNAASSRQLHKSAGDNRRHVTAKERHNQQQRGPRSARTNSTEQEVEDEDEVMQEQKHERSHAQQRKRKQSEEEDKETEKKDEEVVRDKRQRRDRERDAPQRTAGKNRRVDEQRDKEETGEEENDKEDELPSVRTKARHATIVEDDSDSDGQQHSEWTVGPALTRSQAAATKRSAPPAPFVSLSGGSESNTTCVECRLMAKLHCSTRRCNKHCVKLGKACKAHGHKGKERPADRADKQRDAAATRPRETITIADGDDEDDVPLSTTASRRRQQREAREARSEWKEHEENREERQRSSEDDEHDEEKAEEELGGVGSDERSATSEEVKDASPSRRERTKPRVEEEPSKQPSDRQQSRPQRTQSKGSMDLSAVLRQQMETRKAVAEQQQREQHQQQQVGPTEKQSTLQAPAQRDEYVSQMLIESQLEDVLLHAPAQVLLLHSAYQPHVSDEVKQPAADSESTSLRDSGEVILDTPPTPPSQSHAAPASDSSTPATASIPTSTIPLVTADSLASAYLPAASESSPLRLHGPPLVVLYALHIHCGSQLNAQRWLNGLPALCKAGHVVAHTAPYTCTLCSCAARWEPPEDTVLRDSMVDGSRRVDKEEMDPSVEQLVSERGKEAVSLRRSYLRGRL